MKRVFVRKNSLLKNLRKKLSLRWGRKKTSLGDDDVGNEKENVFETKCHRCKTYYGYEDDDEDRG